MALVTGFSGLAKLLRVVNKAGARTEWHDGVKNAIFHTTRLAGIPVDDETLIRVLGDGIPVAIPYLRPVRLGSGSIATPGPARTVTRVVKSWEPGGRPYIGLILGEKRLVLAALKTLASKLDAHAAVCVSFGSFMVLRDRCEDNRGPRKLIS